MPAKVLRFIPRRELVRLRGQKNYSRWMRINKGLDPDGAEKRHRLFREHAENERKDREWAQRHAPGPAGAQVVPFFRLVGFDKLMMEHLERRFKVGPSGDDERGSR